MSDVAGCSSSKDTKPTQNPQPNEAFIRAIARIAIAQLCEIQGFQGFHQSALESLTHVAIRYVRELGRVSNQAAASAARSECNIFDVVRALEDLGSVQGFPGASDVCRLVLGSGVVGELIEYAGMSEECPFVYSLPRFPVSKGVRVSRSFGQAGVEPPGEHIPLWLPAFPGEGNGDVSKELELESESRLVGLQQEGLEFGESSKVKKMGEVNPFVAPPLLYGEKEVAVVDHPYRFFDGNTYGIGHEPDQNKVGDTEEGNVNGNGNGNGNGNDNGNGNGNGNAVLGGRPKVQFKLNSGRKSLRIGEKEVFCFFERAEDDMDEKKQIAEQIMKEAMEIALDQAEL